MKAGFYKVAFPNLSVEIDPDKSYDHFMNLIRSVNPDLQWDKQWKIRDRKAVEDKLADPSVRIYKLLDGDKPVGFSVIKPAPSTFRSRFSAAAANKPAMEIDYLALFHGEEGKGRGAAFFQIFFDKIFKDNEIVYWTQYSSNAPTLKDFYVKKMGMTLLDTDVVPDFRIA